MQTLWGNGWAKYGTALLWNRHLLQPITQTDQVYSLRQFLRLAQQPLDHWPEDLPANHGKTLVVAGLDSCLEVLDPDDAQNWLTDTLRPALLRFQDQYQGDKGLVFWLPEGQARIQYSPAEPSYHWKLGLSGQVTFPLLQSLWSGAAQDACHIMATENRQADPIGKEWSGLHLERIS